MDKYMVVLFAVVTGIIGFAILDSIIGDIVTPSGVTNETLGTANASGYLAGTLAHFPVIAGSDSVLCNGTASTDYTLTDSTGAYIVSGASCINDTVKLSYQYEHDTYLSGSLSRIIISYVVPIGLLAILGMAAYLAIAGG